MAVEMQMGRDATIEDFIRSYTSEDIKVSAFFLQQVLTTDAGKKLLVNFNNLTIKYMPELKSMRVKVTMTEEEYQKYKYNPKFLSYDIYGTTELWFMILEANELHSAIQFDYQTIYLYTTDIVNKMARILNLEQEFKDYNTEEVSEALNGNTSAINF